MPPNIIKLKLNRNPIPQLLRSILAGIYIALGATLMLACKADNLPNLVCGIAFSLGLWLVMCADGELFTGNCILLTEYQPKAQQNNLQIIRCLAITYIGNLIGSLLMVTLIYFSNTYIDTAITIATIKCTAPMHITFIKALLCNLCVCLAVSIGCTQKSPLEKFICAMLPVTCFVACGWEHSIADMFFLPLGSANILDILRVIIVATIGNIISGFAIAKIRKHV